MARKPGTDRISAKSKRTLPQYDLLRKLQTEGSVAQ